MIFLWLILLVIEVITLIACTYLLSVPLEVESPLQATMSRCFLLLWQLTSTLCRLAICLWRPRGWQVLRSKAIIPPYLFNISMKKGRSSLTLSSLLSAILPLTLEDINSNLWPSWMFSVPYCYFLTHFNCFHILKELLMQNISFSLPCSLLQPY